MASEDVYATLLLNDLYLPGALVLGHSLRDAGTTKKLAVLVTTDSVSTATLGELQRVYDYVIPVERIVNQQPQNLSLMNRVDLHSTFTKITLWKQTQFRRIVYMDSDMVAWRAPDELFDIAAPFSAAPDIGWPDMFNSGLMVLKPNMGDYWALHAMAQRGMSFDGADQGLLNMHFKNTYNRLSFTYNVTPSAHYQYVPAYRHFQSGISATHFIGKQKPWMQGREASNAPGPYNEITGRWWAVYDRHYRGEPHPIVQHFVKGEFQPQIYTSPSISTTPTESEISDPLTVEPSFREANEIAADFEVKVEPIPEPTPFNPEPAPYVPDQAPFVPESPPFVPKPAPFVQQQAPLVQQPESFAQQPAPSVQQRESFVQQPKAFAQHPAPFVRQPESFAQRPAQFVQQPASFVQHPAPSVQHPAPSVQHPAPSVQHPAPSVRQPAPSVQQPAQFVQQPAPFVQQPAPSIQQPAPSFPEPPPKVQEFIAPFSTWDPSRSAPPAHSKPEAVNFPATQYTMSSDPTPYKAPERYPDPPKDMYYEVPKTPAYQKPAPIFPWEKNAPKPTRVFVEDETEQAISESAPTEEEVEPVTPLTPAAAFIPTDPWQSFSNITRNAWDDIPEIERYIGALQKNRKGKVQVLHGGVDPASTPGGRRASTRVTDFPSELERPSLPVTPAPIRRPRFWGAGREEDGGGELPVAEGVPAQADWVCLQLWICFSQLLVLTRTQDPVKQLEALARRQSEVVGRALGEGREIPRRGLPFGSEGLNGGSPMGRTEERSPRGEAEGKGKARQPTVEEGAVETPSYSGPGAAWEKDEGYPSTRDTPLGASEEELDALAE